LCQERRAEVTKNLVASKKEQTQCGQQVVGEGEGQHKRVYLNLMY